MKKIIFSVFLVTQCTRLTAQDWNTALNAAVVPNNLFGTTTNLPINIYTNNLHRAYFSTNTSLSGLNGPGDGLYIRNVLPTGGLGSGEIAIFTTGGATNGTEIKMGLSGNIAGRNNRFEMWGNYSGLFFNTYTGTGVHKFAQRGRVFSF